MNECGERHAVVPGVVVCDPSYFTGAYGREAARREASPRPVPRAAGIATLVAVGAFGAGAVAMVVAFVLLVQHLIV